VKETRKDWETDDLWESETPMGDTPTGAMEDQDQVLHINKLKQDIEYDPGDVYKYQKKMTRMKTQTQ